MAASGPFEPRPSLAVAVSGGADSMCLAVLARDWVLARGGSLLALVVDHGLRAESADEAALTLSRLTTLRIPARQLTVIGLSRGAGLAARARAARYEVLLQTCADAGRLHLLLGHHAADQAETLMIRVLSGSGGRGLAGMPAVHEAATVRLLRPLLAVPPAVLRAFLTDAGVPWVEDPSNADRRALRPRIRSLRDNDAGGTKTLAEAANAAGRHRAVGNLAIGRVLAERVVMRPEGFAILSPGAIAPEALAALIRTVAGADFAPGTGQLATMAADPGPCTVWGVRILPAGRLGRGWLVVREAAAIGDAVEARHGVIWDGRFRLHAAHAPLEGLTIGALGDDARAIRRRPGLPVAVLRTLPALRRGNVLVAVPHLDYPDFSAFQGVRLVFNPPHPLASAPFLPA